MYESWRWEQGWGTKPKPLVIKEASSYLSLRETTQWYHFLLIGAKGEIGIFWVVGMDFREFYMVWGGNMGIWLKKTIIGTHGLQQ